MTHPIGWCSSRSFTPSSRRFIRSWTATAAWVACWCLSSSGNAVSSVRPMFYISAWFEARRDAYYERLLAVSRDDDWTGWCRFFLEAVRAQAEGESDQGEEDPRALRGHEGAGGGGVTRSRYAILTLDWIFEHPIFNSGTFAEATDIPDRTARRLLTAFARARDPAGVQSRQRSPRDHSRVSGVAQHRGRARCVLMITSDRQTGLGGGRGRKERVWRSRMSVKSI